jgi:hypothetical protein
MSDLNLAFEPLKYNITDKNFKKITKEDGNYNIYGSTGVYKINDSCKKCPINKINGTPWCYNTKPRTVIFYNNYLNKQ